MPPAWYKDALAVTPGNPDCVACKLDAGIERTQILAELREGAALDEQDENDDSYAFHVPQYTRSARRDVCERRVSDYG